MDFTALTSSGVTGQGDFWGIFREQNVCYKTANALFEYF